MRRRRGEHLRVGPHLEHDEEPERHERAGREVGDHEVARVEVTAREERAEDERAEGRAEERPEEDV